MTVQRARTRAKDSKKDGRTRRERLRSALLGRPEMVQVERLTGPGRVQRPVWRTETYGPFGLGTHRDPRWAQAAERRSR